MSDVHKGSCPISRGRWYIFEWNQDRDTGMYHQCNPDTNICHAVRYFKHDAPWSTPNRRYKEGWKCTTCLKPALPSIIALFTLGWWNEATKEL